MGPEGSGEDHEYDSKYPPRWDGVSTPFHAYKQELGNWPDFTKLDKKSQGPAMISCLTLEAKNLALTVPRTDRITEKGAELILKKLEEAYKISDEYEQFVHYKSMTNYKMGDKSIEAAISGFLARAQKLKNTGVDLPDSLLTFMLLDCVGLTEDQENALFGACNGQMTLQNVSASLKQIKKSASRPIDTRSYPTDSSQLKICTCCRSRGYNSKNHDYLNCYKLKKFKEKLASKRKPKQEQPSTKNAPTETSSTAHHSNSSNTLSNREVWNFVSKTADSRHLIDPMIDTCAQQTVIGAYALSNMEIRLKLTS